MIEGEYNWRYCRRCMNSLNALPCYYPECIYGEWVKQQHQAMLWRMREVAYGRVVARLPVKDLARQFGVSVRTIYRDVRLIRDRRRKHD
jgi:hypothetical protein